MHHQRYMTEEVEYALCAAKNNLLTFCFLVIISSITAILSLSNHYIDYYSASTYVLHFGQNNRTTSLKFIPSQSSCRVLSVYPLCPIQPRQCRFLYCNLSMMGSREIFFKKCNMHMHMTNLLPIHDDILECFNKNKCAIFFISHT